MAINRYYGRNRYAEFQPMSFEEIAAVPLAYQQQHNLSQQAMMALNDNVLGIPGIDDEYAQEVQAQLDNKISEITGRLANEGYSPGITSDVIAAQQFKKDLFGPRGDAGRLAANVAAYQAFKEELDKDSNISQADKDKALAMAMYKYKQAGGARGGNRFNGSKAPKTINVAEKVLNIVKGIPDETIEKMTGWQRSDKPDPVTGDYIWRKSGQTTTGIPEEVTRYVAEAYAYQDPEILDELRFYADYNETFGSPYSKDPESGSVIMGDKYYDPDKFDYTSEYIKGNINNAINMAVAYNSPKKTTYNDDIKFQSAGDGAGFGFGGFYGDVPPIYEPMTGYETAFKNMGITLSRVGKPAGTQQTKMGRRFGGNEGTQAGNYTVQSNIDTNPFLKASYDRIFSGLKETGVLPQDAERESPETVDVVQKYIRENSELQYQTPLYENGLTTRYVNGQLSQYKNAPSNVGKAISLNKRGYIYMDPENPGKTYTYDKLLEEGWVTKESSEGRKEDEFQGLGVYDLKNYFAVGLTPENQRAFAQPYKVRTSTGKELIVGTDRNQITAADLKFNNLWAQATMGKGLPVREGNAIVVYQGGDRFTVTDLAGNPVKTDSQGNPMPLNSEEIRRLMNGVEIKNP